MRNSYPPLPWIFLCFSLFAGACEAPPPRRVIVRAGRLLDGAGGDVQTGVRVTLEDGLVAAIAPDVGEPPSGTDIHVVDARGATVLPGLVDAHTHLLASAACTPGRGAGLRQGLRNVHAYAAAGVTTVADLGGPARVMIGLRRYVGTGRSRGPRVLVAGPMLTAPGGYPVGTHDAMALRKRGVVRELASVAEAHAAVRELADVGVDLIKVALQAQHFDGNPLPVLSDELVCAVVEEAHKQDLRVLAHAISERAYATALACQVDALAHGSGEPLSADLIDRLATGQVPVVPTLHVFEAVQESPAAFARRNEALGPSWALSDIVRTDLAHYIDGNARPGPFLPDVFGVLVPRAPLQAGSEARRRNVQLLAARGVPLAFGTDSSFCNTWAGAPVDELEKLVEAGLSPAAALRAATSGGARALGLEDAIGTLKVGYRADMIVVDGRPDEDVTALRRVQHVFIDGVPQARGPAPWYGLALLLVELGRTWLAGN